MAALSHRSATHPYTRPCVLDLSVLLTPYGLELVKSLGTVLELWISRELWHILNDTHFYLRDSQSILLANVSAQLNPSPFSIEQEAALQNLASFSMDVGLTHLNLFWIGDRLGESLIPPYTDSRLLHRWELLAQALDSYINQQQKTHDPLTPVWRDTLSLAAALDAAFILTVQPIGKTQDLPDVCRTMAGWGIACREIEPLDAIATLERDSLRQLFVQAGLSKFLWAGLNLTILHLIVPAAALCGNTNFVSIDHFADSESNITNSAFTFNPWNDSQGFWYRI
jgi:hypothetical protein